MTIKDRIRMIRKSKKKTIEQFSDTIGVPVRTISNYERGERGISVDYLYRLYTQLNANIHWVLTGKGSMYESGDEGAYFKMGVASPGVDYGISLEARVAILERQLAELKNQTKKSPPGGLESSEAGPGEAGESGSAIPAPDHPSRRPK